MQMLINCMHGVGMKIISIVIVLILSVLTVGCQKAQSQSQVVCPRPTDLPIYTIRYPVGKSPNGVYPVIVAVVPHTMEKEEFLLWLNAHKSTHFVVALPPISIQPISESRIQYLLTNLSCRYAIDISNVERR